MWKYWPYKKDYLLIAGSVVLLIICYRLAFSRTIADWRVYRELNSQVSAGEPLAYQPGYLEHQSRSLEKILALYKSDTTLFRSNTITTIAALADKHGVKLTGLPVEETLYHTPNAILQKLSFTGDFFALNRFWYDLELSKGLGMPRSVVIKKERKGAETEAGKLNMDVLMEIRK
ncbi:MAG: hypothetical protein AAGC65_01715 [Mucilaginibacter sp.]|uniref:hypothetical protein n=1 Tax=Mucilaginibacter sp. TaxID=1882438 RepID=UPI00319F4739